MRPGMQLQDFEVNKPNLFLPGTFYLRGNMESAIRSAKAVDGKSMKQDIAEESN
jgi:hypothetical protein